MSESLHSGPERKKRGISRVFTMIDTIKKDVFDPWIFFRRWMKQFLRHELHVHGLSSKSKLVSKSLNHCCCTVSMNYLKHFVQLKGWFHEQKKRKIDALFLSLSLEAKEEEKEKRIGRGRRAFASQKATNKSTRVVSSSFSLASSCFSFFWGFFSLSEISS